MWVWVSAGSPRRRAWCQWDESWCSRVAPSMYLKDFSIFWKVRDIPWSRREMMGGDQLVSPVKTPPYP